MVFHPTCDHSILWYTETLLPDTPPRSQKYNATRPMGVIRMNANMSLPADYGDWLASLKLRIQGTRQRTLLSANAAQIRLYHDIGRDILVRQSQQGWGSKVIEQLSADLRATFPEMKGFSATNLKYMRFFAEHCPNRQFVQRAAKTFSTSQIGQQRADQLAAPHDSDTTLADQLPGSTLSSCSQSSASQPCASGMHSKQSPPTSSAVDLPPDYTIHQVYTPAVDA